MSYSLHNCKQCGALVPVPDPEPKVVVREVQVDHSEGHYWVRAVMYATVLVTVIVAGMFGAHAYEQRTMQKAIEEPTMKVEIIEHDNVGRVIKKITR